MMATPWLPHSVTAAAQKAARSVPHLTRSWSRWWSSLAPCTKCSLRQLIRSLEHRRFQARTSRIAFLLPDGSHSNQVFTGCWPSQGCSVAYSGLFHPSRPYLAVALSWTRRAPIAYDQLEQSTAEWATQTILLRWRVDCILFSSLLFYILRSLRRTWLNFSHLSR